MRILQKQIKIQANAKTIGNYYRLVIRFPEAARLVLPGQFVMVKAGKAEEPLLRRPLSVHKINGPAIEILYEVVGKGTEILAKRKAGEYIDVVGPLGSGFQYRKPEAGKQKPILVAGGMGVAPLVFLAQKLKNSKGLVLIGARTKKQVLCEKEFQKLGFDVKIATDDGSAGFCGRVTGLLENILRNNPITQERNNLIYACGPRPMLKEISRLAGRYKIPAQISLEEHMACGIGACLGCVVKTQAGFKRACKEGPVFSARDIAW
jgi:dihydroorotate dehydrogenase electron transfer subunit